MMQRQPGLPAFLPLPPAMRAVDVPQPPPDVVPLPPSPHPVPPAQPTPPEIIEPPLPGQEPVRDPIVVPGEGIQGLVMAWRQLH